LTFQVNPYWLTIFDDYGNKKRPPKTWTAFQRINLCIFAVRKSKFFGRDYGVPIRNRVAHNKTFKLDGMLKLKMNNPGNEAIAKNKSTKIRKLDERMNSINYTYVDELGNSSSYDVMVEYLSKNGEVVNKYIKATESALVRDYVALDYLGARLIY